MTGPGGGETRSESGLLVVTCGDGDSAVPWSDRKPDPVIRKRVPFGFSVAGTADSEQIILAR
jgi:hypothetical protein